jgi:L-lactate dehydrogenase complex protein LldF
MNARVPQFHVDSEKFLADGARVGWHDGALWHLRYKRDLASQQVPDWEALRDQAAAIKAHVIDHVPELLAQFIRNAEAAGWIVHLAPEAEDLRREALALLKSHGVTKVVKSKSMLTEECGLNHHLEANGIEVIDTDLGERIVQLRHEPPSHIVVPAIHLKRAEIGELFHEHLGTAKGEDDPLRLTRAARADLRKRFLGAQAGLTGVNFAVAESGAIVICTNEGNADLGTALQPLHIACMGVEKLVPTTADVGVFLRLLARSATGQPITTYSTHLSGPDPTRPGHEAHLFIVDAGRSRLHRDDEHRRALSCIRCGACMNTCPVYRRASGHAYGTTVPGPIGAVLAPAMIGTAKAKELPFASTLCGSCTNVCPVKIDLHDQLLSWRRRLAREGHVPFTKRFAMKLGARLLTSPWLFALGGKLARTFWGLARRGIPGPHAGWTKHRDLPPAPKQSFRRWWKDGGKDAGTAPAKPKEPGHG